MRINIDFAILEDTINPKEIVIIDESCWGEIEDRKAILEVTAPGYNSPVTHYLNKNRVTRITARTFGIQGKGRFPNADLPDGIYKIAIIGSPPTYFREKYHLKDHQLRLKLDQAIISAVGTCTEASDYSISMFMKVRFLMEVAHAYVRSGDFCNAQIFYDEASTLLNKLKCNNDGMCELRKK